MARAAEQQLAVGERLRELRGAKTQPAIADAVGVTLRAYQHWEAGGGISWDNLQGLAEHFGVTENYILYGTNEGPGHRQEQLDRIEEKLDDLLGFFAAALNTTRLVTEESRAVTAAAVDLLDAAATAAPAQSTRDEADASQESAQPAPPRKRRAQGSRGG